MARQSLRLTATLLMLGVGAIATALWMFPRPAVPEPDNVEAGSVVVQQERTYADRLLGSCETEDGFRCSLRLFESSDGRSFSQEIVSYDSPKRANTELRKRLREASEIVTRQPLFDEQGQRQGEKAVATFIGGDPPRAQAEILWTYGPKFTSVSAASLDNILEYDKEFPPGVYPH